MTAALIAAVTLVMGWFAVGSIRNVRKGSATLRWFREGLPQLGEKTTLRWFGTSSVELVLARAKPPFESVTLVVFLEPRDVPWIWAFSRWRGRRDTLIVRGQTRRPPAHDIEALSGGSWSARDAQRRITSETWPLESPAADGLTIFAKAESDRILADALLELARGAGMAVRRLSVRRQGPHFQLHVDLPAPTMPATPFFQALRAIAERATNG
jgi:hypothetical protein